VKPIVSLILLFLISGCAALKRPAIALKDASLIEKPVLVERGGYYYVRFRHQVLTNAFNPCRIVDVRTSRDAAYFFFVGKISMQEFGERKEFPVASYGDSCVELARRSRVYWLDPDGTAHLLPLVQERD
jgi:hypothetical protein